MFKNALVSTSDKTGLVDFLKPLAETGMRIVSTGGTARHLREAGLEVIDVSEQTGFKEVMDGRVKTLHPKVHMALLARGGNQEDSTTLEEFGIEGFDLVVGNLYPFEQALKKGQGLSEQIEFIDIGGPSFLRAAAKNFECIAVVCDPVDYSWLASKKELTMDDRRSLAAKVFFHTSSYDSLIGRYLNPNPGVEFSLGGCLVDSLRYGENPQQSASWFRTHGLSGLHEAEVLQGKALSYNNILDLDAAVTTLINFDETTCVSVKHTNPCGVASGTGSVSEVVKQSLQADPVSVFGGIVAINREVDDASSEALSNLFLECVIAPSFSDSALKRLGKKKNLRVLRWSSLGAKLEPTGLNLKTVLGGFLTQTHDQVEEWSKEWEICGDTPDEDTKREILFAYKVCGHLKSNAIAITSQGCSRGLGMGQVNRVDAVEQAISRTKKFHAQAQNLVLASDAFFPFPDSIELAAKAGIRWVIQPGGSIKDDEVKAKAKELGVNMVLTGRRHFQH